MPLISVIMPVFNCEKYLELAIGSILAQTMTDFEFIIINDGSTDNSASFISAYTDPRISFYNYPSNKGIVNRLNFGFSIAKGKYIARMDADDISHPNRFEIQSDFLERNSDVILCGTFCSLIGENGHILYPGWVKESEHEKLKIQLLFGCPICHPSVMINSILYKKHALNFNSEFEDSEDYNMWYKMAKLSKIANIPQILLRYRTHTSQVSRRKFENQTKTTLRNITEQLKTLGIHPNERQLQIHLQVTNFYFKTEISDIRPNEIYSWLDKLEILNSTSNTYNKILFSNYLSMLREITLVKFSTFDVSEIKN